MKRIIEWLIPSHITNDDEKTKARIFVFSCLTVWLLGVLMTTLYLTIISTPLSNFIATAALVVFSTLLLQYFRKSGNLKTAANTLLAFGLLALNVSIAETGGVNSMDMIWLMVFPCGAFLLLNNKTALFWGGLTIATTFAYLMVDLAAPHLLLKPKPDAVYNFVSVFLCIIIVALTIYYFVQQNNLYGLVLAQKNKKLVNAQEEMIEQHLLLQQKQGEITTQNEELIQSQEEIITQRDFIEQKNRILEHRDNQISNSIKAAQVIQQAVLPNAQTMQKFLGDHFIIFRPKDVVSGDFYWVDEVAGKKVLASVDCTGHGVPGAFMSLIGHNLLDNIVSHQQITDPAEIISAMHTEVVKLLKQEDGNNNYGMDMTVCTWESSSDGCNITFCGAKNSFYYKEPRQRNYTKLKGTRKSIGGFQPKDVHFENQTIKVSKGSMFYIGSDGIEDQNNSKRKKFGAKRVLQILNDSAHLTLPMQKGNLEIALDKHMEDTTQRDDILLIGVRV